MKGTPSLQGRSSQLGPVISLLSPLAAITSAEEQSCPSGTAHQTSAPLSVLRWLLAFSTAQDFSNLHIWPRMLFEENPAGFSPEG